MSSRLSTWQKRWKRQTELKAGIIGDLGMLTLACSLSRHRRVASPLTVYAFCSTQALCCTRTRRLLRCSAGLWAFED